MSARSLAPRHTLFTNAGDRDSSGVTRYRGSKTAFIAAKFLDRSITVQLVKLSLEVRINNEWKIQECKKCLSTGTEGKTLIARLKLSKKLMRQFKSRQYFTKLPTFFFHKINFSAIYKLPLNPFILYDLQNAFYLKVFKLDSLYGFVKEHHLSTSEALPTEKYN